MGTMKTDELCSLLDARVFSKPAEETGANRAFASDLMSDVLTLFEDHLLLITGLNTLQTIRTAEMADIRYVMLVRGKIPDERMIQLAEEQGISLLSTEYSMFRVSGILFAAGLDPVY